jgi:peptide-methionine (S)-S-oxide reductase
MFNKQQRVTRETALKGRSTPMTIDDIHFVNQTRLSAEPADGQDKILLGMGCFWGAEKLFWQLDGVLSTSVGYAGGYTQNPTYEEVCSGETGHSEVVRIIYHPSQLPLEKLLTYFWENHDPTQGMRQGNDLGTQYRSAIYVYNHYQQQTAEQSKIHYQQALARQHLGLITTEILSADTYYFAENYHQQYLAKHPDGYCGLAGTGVCFVTQ